MTLKDLQARFDAASRNYCTIYGLERDCDWVMLKLLEEVGELTQVWNRRTGRGRPNGQTAAELHQSLADETADVLGMILLVAQENNLDLEAAILRKWKFDPADQTIGSEHP